ncbi:MAG: alpha/beta fold hydrolase [Desertimonas sp.]
MSVLDGIEAAPATAATVVAPELPPGRDVELEGGTVFVRDVPGPSDGPALFLLHGWTATADLNFFRNYQALSQHARVLAFDHRGHGRGLRGRRAFRMEDCADDVVAVADALGIERFVVLGYSMGGAVAQLLWRRHGHRLDGLVLCATAPHFNRLRNERISFVGLGGLAALARVTPPPLRRRLTHRLYLSRKTSTWEPWAIQEAATHDWRMVLEAGTALGRFRSDEWLGEVDVPTSVVITMQDRVVGVRRQLLLFEDVPTAAAFRIDADHDAAIGAADRFNRIAGAAIDSVIERR